MNEGKDSERKTSYSAEEYTPEIKRQKAHGAEVKLQVCENCNQRMQLPNGQCIQCGHEGRRIGSL